MLPRWGQETCTECQDGTGKIRMRGGSEGLDTAAGGNWTVVISQEGLHWSLHTAGGECACVPIIQDFYPSLKDMLENSGV